MTGAEAITGRLEVDVRLPLDRFDLAVAFSSETPVLGLFGPSGAGKTSLLEVVAGLRRARGTVRVGGETWLDSDAGLWLSPERRRVGYVPQDGLLFPHLDVRRNLLAGRHRQLAGGAEPAIGLEATARLLELTPLLDRDVRHLSGGERQRVALGRAICSGPRLLLLDEPLASLDLPLRRKLLPFLRRVREELRIPMLLVSHDPVEVQALCDEVVVLRRGARVGRGAPRRVLTDPAVFPVSELKEFENVVACRLERHLAGTSVVRIGAAPDGPELVTVRTGAEPGAPLLLGLPANEIILATEPPRGLSARNVLPAVIRRIDALENLGLVSVDLDPGGTTLTVEVTETTPAELGLASGRRVYVVVKATSCRLYGDR